MEKLPNQQEEEVNQKYDIIFIGGGPSTLSFLAYLCRNKNFENFFNNLNILLLEKSEAFGSGCLGKYGINSNTSAEGFVRLICFNDDENGNEEKQNLSPNKKKPQNENKKTSNNNENNTNPAGNMNNNNSNNNGNIFQKFKNKVVPFFEELLECNEAKNLLTMGSKIAPLSMIGNFLDCIGNAIANYIHKKFRKKILMNNSEVLKINYDHEKCMENYVNSITNNSPSLKVSEVKNHNFFPFDIIFERNIKIGTGNNNGHKTESKLYSVKSKVVVMANGAQQKFESKSKQEILKHINPSDFYHSDYVLQEQGFNNLITNLKSKEKKKVVIIGGSHSGFSCAWILLNGYSDITKISEINKTINTSSPIPKNKTDSYKAKIDHFCPNCKTQFCCYGAVVDRSWKNSKDYFLNFTNFNLDGLEIVMLFRDHIKVYYHSEREALNDGYNLYDPQKAVNKNGNVYPFIGIRGDAKELYRKITSGKEKRVKIVKCSSFADQKQHLSKASCVIWACGYTTQKLNIFENYDHGKEVEFYVDSNNQFEVDKEVRLLSKKKIPFFNFFGIGQGYSTHSIEILSNGKYARADSVNLYNTYISKKLIRSLDSLFNFSGEWNEDRENQKITQSKNNQSSLNVQIVNKDQQMSNKVNQKYSSKKIIQLIPPENNTNSRYSKNFNSNNNVNNIVDNPIKKLSGQNFFNTPNLKSNIINNLANVNNINGVINFNDGKKFGKSHLLPSTILSNGVNSELKNSQLNLHRNKENKPVDMLHNQNLIKTNLSKGFEKFNNSSKTNFHKPTGLIEASQSQILPSKLIDFSPPSRSINIKSPNNDSCLMKYPAKRESSKLKPLNLQNNQIMQMNSQSILNNSTIFKKTNQINMNMLPSSSTTKIYTNKNVIISRDYKSKSPRENQASLEPSPPYKETREKNFSNPNLKKSNIPDYNRNQIYFGTTHNSKNSISQSNIFVEKNHEMNRLSQGNKSNSNNYNFGSLNNTKKAMNSPNMDKNNNRNENSPIPILNRSRSKYLLYDASRNSMNNLISSNNKNGKNPK